VSPGNSAVFPIYGASWTYYSRNSSLERKRRLVELGIKYGKVRAAAVVCEGSLGDGVRDVSPELFGLMNCGMDVDELGEQDSGNEDGASEDEPASATLRGLMTNSSLVSLLSLPSSHPFHGTTTMEQRQRYWDSLPTYSGASTPVGVGGPSRGLVSAFSSFSTTTSFPEFSSFATLRPTSVVDEHGEGDEAWEDVDVSREENGRRKAICDEERPNISSPAEAKGKDKGKGKEKAKLSEILCCRAQTGTPVGQSRLPVRVGAAISVKRRYKMKKGLVRMSLDSRKELAQGPSTQMSLMPRRGRTPPPRPRRPDEEDLLLLAPSASSSSSSLPSSSTESSERDERSLEDRLRNTTLEDLPLGEHDAAEVRSLVAELVRDREGMSGTWPPRSRRASGTNT
jgi:hypothetical protein